jgi:cytoskeletal protein RodZ
MWLIVGLSVLIGAVFMAAFVTWFTRSQRETDPHPQQSPAPVSAPVQPVEPAVEEPPSAPETPEIDEVDAPPEPLAADTAVETEPVPIP